MKLRNFLIIIVLFSSVYIYSNWTSPEMIWPYSLAYFQPNAAHSMVADTLGNVHLIWYDASKDAYYGIRYRYHNGTEWLYNGSRFDDPPPGGLPDSIAGYYALSWMPTMSVDESGKLLMVWEDWRSGSFELYAKYFNGSIWSTQKTVTATYDSYTWFPKLYYKNGKHHLIFMDDSTGYFNIYYTNYDTIFNQKTRITPIDANCINTDIAVLNNDDVSVIFTMNNDGNMNLYNVRMTSGVWGGISQIFTTEATVNSPTIISDGSAEYALFTCAMNGTFQMFISKRSGSSYQTPKMLTENNSNIYYPTGLIIDGKVRIVFVSDDYSFGNLYTLLYNPVTDSVEEQVKIASHYNGYIETPQIVKSKSNEIHVVYIVNDEKLISDFQTNDMFWVHLPYIKDKSLQSEDPYRISYSKDQIDIKITDDKSYSVMIIDKAGRKIFETSTVKNQISIKNNVFKKNDIYFIYFNNGAKSYAEKVLWLK